MPRISDLKAGMRDGDETPRPGMPAAPLLDAAGTQGVTSYALAALSAECLLVASAVEGTRNDTLNRAGFNVAQLVAGGQLPATLAVAELTNAGRAAGLDDPEIRQTLGSSLPAGAALPRTAPPLPALDWVDGLPASAPSNAGAKPETPAADPEPASEPATRQQAIDGMFNHDVALELHREHVKETARRMLKAEREKGQGKPRMVGLRDFLAEPDEDVQYRVQELWPTGGRVVFAAQYKTGKSTAVGNVIRALADGAPLFDTYTTAPAGRVVLIDNELDERTLRRWLRDQGVVNVDAVTLIPLRGMVSSFDILDPETRQQWVEAISTQKPDVIILDCLRPVLDALGLSEDKDAGQFLVAFDAMLHGTGASEALVVHHMGHGGQRSRGDSRILDWPDATWKLIRQDPDDLQSPRYFSAFGRDVEVAEARLEFDPETRHLALVGGSRRRTGIEEGVTKLAEFLATQPGPLSQRAIEGAMPGRHQVWRDALKEGAAQGIFVKGYTGWSLVVRHD